MKYLIMLACMVIQICLGGVYAWSSFVPELETSFALSNAQTQLVFGCLFGVFTLSMVVSGRVLERLGPRATATIGALLFGTGYLVASFSGGQFALILLGISVFVGAGTGFGYVCPLSTCMKWFPSQRGLATGVSMAGFGGGAVVLSALAEHLLSGGMPVLVVFRGIGIAYGAALLAAAAVLRLPASSGESHSRSTFSSVFLARDPFFLSLLIGMFSGTFAGMLVIGNLKPLALYAGIPAVAAAAAISAFALGNASGRIASGWISDRTDERIVPLKLAALGAALALLWLANTPALFIAGAFAVGVAFGACFVVYAAQVASRYGWARVAGIYPLVFLAYGAAGVAGPSLGGWMYDTTSSYSTALALSCGVVGFGMVASAWLLRKARASASETGQSLPYAAAHERRDGVAEACPVHSDD